jgi:hypothetical protein
MKNKITLLILSLGAFVIFTSEIMNAGGKAGFTGSPSENTCTQCHGGGQQTGTVTIDIPQLPNNNAYVPGTSYQASITVNHQGSSKFGMGAECLKVSDNASAGTFTASATTTNVLQAANGRTNIVHKSGGVTTANTATFNFTWNAPATDVGTVKFYVACNATNGNGNTSGDVIYTTTKTIFSPVSVGLKSNTIANNNILTWPNPCNNNLHIQYQNKENTLVEILDINGRVIETLSQENGNGLMVKNVSVSNYSNGIYFVRYISGDIVEVKKIIKN